MPKTLTDIIDEIHAGIPDSAWDEVAYRQWLHEMYRTMDFLMKSALWGAVNAYARHLHDAEPARAIAFLRFTSDVPRDKLVEWSRLLRMTKEHIAALGGDAERMLRGLNN